MPMSPRLLRPIASGVHPEAAAWRSAVVANGGSVSASTLKAVSKFCADIDKAGLRDRFYRLNLFCGTGLNACLVPLYRGQSRTGTQYGNTTDTNNGPFVSGDYAETGASGGLQGNGSSKYLNTGLAPSTLTDTSRHLSFYANAVNSGAYNAYMGCRTGSSGTTGKWFKGWTVSPATTLWMHTIGINASAAQGQVANHTAGFYIATNDTSDGYYYKNGTSVDTTDTGQTPTAGSANAVTLFALNREGGVGEHGNGRMSGYSIGAHLTAAQASDFNTAMQSFQTALGRNV